MDEQKIEQIAQRIYQQNATSREFTVSNTSFHTHNGTDSQRIKQGNIINGTTSNIHLVSVASETFTVNTISNITLITLNGIAAKYYSSTFTFTGTVSAGDTSATLSSNWTRTTGVYIVTFSSGEQRSVTLTSGATTATWSGALGSNATATFSASKNLKASINGNAQLGNCLEYGGQGNGSIIYAQGKEKLFLQNCNSIYIDANNLLNTKVLSVGTCLAGVIDQTYTNSSLPPNLVVLEIIEWTGSSIKFKTTLAADWYIDFFLSMS